MSSDECMEPLSWETRNLGLESFGISASFIENPAEQLLAASLESLRKKFGKIFVQARVPKQHMPVARLLEKHGFYFVETALSPHTVLNKNPVLENFMRSPAEYLPKRYEAADVNVKTLVKPVNRNLSDIMTISGESFTDDRFHLDPLCNAKTADARYVYWVGDMARDEAVTFHLLAHHEETIAFMARKQDNLLLAGFAQRYIGSGLGDYLWLAVLAKMREEGLGAAHTLISANNIPVLNLYARLGFKFRNPSATFHYWSE